ncbi:MAG: sugar transporter ATP-binding protein, partial [Clostridiales bacterium]|nr:sugar transporter ATP-binding protein [Clostridiales bacterium]
MSEVIMELRNITKYFPGVVALDNMSLQVRKGEVHGLIGENGAGKSTLIKVLTGVHQPDKGEILIDGKEFGFSNPNDAKKVGIGCVYQELNIIPEVNVIDNLFIGDYIKGFGPLLDYKKMAKKADEIMSELGQPVNLRTECGRLGIGVQQTIEIGKALLNNTRLIIMDEPTSSLSKSEVHNLFKTIRMLKERGLAILFVS